MYTAKLSLSSENVDDVLAVASFLQMQDIITACHALKSLAEPAASPGENMEASATEGKLLGRLFLSKWLLKRALPLPLGQCHMASPALWGARGEELQQSLRTPFRGALLSSLPKGTGQPRLAQGLCTRIHSSSRPLLPTSSCSSSTSGKPPRPGVLTHFEKRTLLCVKQRSLISTVSCARSVSLTSLPAPWLLHPRPSWQPWHDVRTCEESVE